MPARWTIGGHVSNASGGSSRASSRASSPTRGPSLTSRPSQIMLPSRRREGAEFGADSADYFSSAQPSPAYDSTPAQTPGWGASTPGWATPSAMSTPGGSNYGGHALDIALDNDHLVLRGQGGDMEPAYLAGRVELNLSESTNIKEINMTMTGKAKVQFADAGNAGSKNRHFSHPIITHDWSFLQGGKGHAHTLKAGYHSFPFSFTLEGNLPSTLRTYSGDAIIVYKLRATVVRSGFASNYTAAKEFSLTRMFTTEALEFNQTLEIENTWPGKVMYSLTLPYKAYAAGDDIPVNVKFMPLAKGVRVTNVVSVLKEYTLVHTRHSSHPDTRVDSCIKHEIKDGRAIELAREPIRPPQHWDGAGSNRGSASTSRHPSPNHTPVASTRGRLAPNTSTRLPDSYFPDANGNTGSSSAASTSAQPEASSSSADLASLAESSGTDIEIGDDEIDTHFTIPIPAWVTPSHSIHPVFITHKIKWSCSISNPDGHTSELRCALPITILSHSLLDEARAASASTRGLLFGGNQSEEQPVDLPSYSNHVYDRIAVADSGSATGFFPRSVAATPMGSPHDDTPPRSRAPSRPGSPVRGRSGDSTPAAGDVPPRRQLSNFVDSELLMSLGALRPHSNGVSPNSTPPDSRAPSRPLSRRGSRTNLSGWSSMSASRAGSRVGSRASSPERGSANSSTVGSYNEEGAHMRPNFDRHRSTGLHGLFHLPKGMRPLSHLGSGGGSGSRPILRNNGTSSNLSLPNSNVIPRNASVPGDLEAAGAQGGAGANGGNHVSFAPHAVTFEPERSTRFELGAPDTPDADDDEDIDPMTQVPSYDIASRGFLGGGIVPIDSRLPTYDASERSMQRTRSGTEIGGSGGLLRPRSDTALVQMGAQAAADAEDRAAEDDSGAPSGALNALGLGDR
ncbi:hypothetical protein I350_00822 [Cryptococcus amylolentus CBS 6273]|uniref:Arrestin C-terminal-like domain-containing protein n=1 Tax=Cryptococcus amylolentus CBS 6273 TaxID=1296118 RepID=A0A1E3KG25_9TREE|nr:hypothetical protein I350_00822 [Cryptococcus amylolentus CBS 6273]